MAGRWLEPTLAEVPSGLNELTLLSSVSYTEVLGKHLNEELHFLMQLLENLKITYVSCFIFLLDNMVAWSFFFKDKFGGHIWKLT